MATNRAIILYKSIGSFPRCEDPTIDPSIL